MCAATKHLQCRASLSLQTINEATLLTLHNTHTFPFRQSTLTRLSLCMFLTCDVSRFSLPNHTDTLKLNPYSVYLLLTHHLRFVPFPRAIRASHAQTVFMRTANNPTCVLPFAEDTCIFTCGVFIKVYTTFAGYLFNVSMKTH